MTMELLYQEFAVTCDYPGCGWEMSFQLHAVKPAEERLAELGWTVRRTRLFTNKYYCPKHSKEGIE